jgi:hypothetical protein
MLVFRKQGVQLSYNTYYEWYTSNNHSRCDEDLTTTFALWRGESTIFFIEMYGLIFDCLEKYVVNTYHRVTWEEVVAQVQIVMASCDHHPSSTGGDEEGSGRTANDFTIGVGAFVVNMKYSDELFLKVLILTAVHLNTETEALVEELGYYFVDYLTRLEPTTYLDDLHPIFTIPGSQGSVSNYQQLFDWIVFPSCLMT